jgi:hypothetical protein
MILLSLRCTMESLVLSAAFWILTIISCCNVWHLKSYIYIIPTTDVLRLINSFDSQLKTRKKWRIVCQNFRKLNLDPNTKSPLKLITVLSILKDYCWNSAKFRFGLLDLFLFKKAFMSLTWVVGMLFNPGSMKVWENFMSTYPFTLVGPMETSRLQASLVWNWKTKLGRKTFKLVLVDRVQNIAVIPTAKY